MVPKILVSIRMAFKAKMSQLPKLLPANQLLSVEERQVRDEEIKNSIHTGLPPGTRRGKFSKAGPRKLQHDGTAPDHTIKPTHKRRHIQVANASCSESSDHPIYSLLESVFLKRRQSGDLWPKIIEPNVVRDCIQNFRSWMIGDGHATACCAVCAQLVSPEDQSQLMKNGPELRFLMNYRGGNMEEGGKRNELDMVDGDVLDSCGQNIDGSFNVCKTCIESLAKLQIPRLSIANNLFCGCCQRQPSYLAGLTQVEEMVIARGRAFGSIIKLRPFGTNPGICYRRVKGHVVVVPLPPQSLLNVLPCSTDDLMDRIQVCRLGHRLKSRLKLIRFSGTSSIITSVVDTDRYRDPGNLGWENRTNRV